ncbi:RNA polymerase sigma-70 factor (ECF subfamily) [Novosphingobium sp. PhB165]|uniref:sigma-70 family RNA polymerase sigma factor n=1 Tax=Novosphingobium sp. PhB165 TaxID=2485105 RepID=UPI0010CF7D47|nr:sigma-70 family RNA polymerase sigma factor [Novosphingobium sp. PhB165]TCM20400.1 RNA polymerase sigma-70 factor (ECF subfamily) [Novosphingobium sp. PhB165]
MPQRDVITDIVTERRDELVRYAGAVSGDADGAEDLVQEAWLRLDQAARVQEVAKPTHLLWRVLRNLSIDRSRRIAHEGRVVAQADERRFAELPDDQASVEAMLIARDELARIQRVLDALDPRTRTAFEMHRFEGAKLREIAARLGVSVTVAHGLVAAAIREIRAAIPR